MKSWRSKKKWAEMGVWMDTQFGFGFYREREEAHCA